MFIAATRAECRATAPVDVVQLPNGATAPSPNTATLVQVLQRRPSRIKICGQPPVRGNDSIEVSQGTPPPARGIRSQVACGAISFGTVSQHVMEDGTGLAMVGISDTTQNNRNSQGMLVCPEHQMKVWIL